MRILYISQKDIDIKTDGISSDLINALIGAKHEVVICCADSKYEKTRVCTDGIKKVEIKVPNQFGVNIIRKGLIILSLERVIKKAIKKHLFENRGIITNTQNIIIGSGIEMLEQILSLISINNITLENPGYHKLASIAKNINKTINYINLDDQGVKIPPKQTILYTTPFNQFPTGIKMSISRKKELLNFALNTNSFIIEDDFDAEFRINSAPTTSLWMLNNDNVIFFSTFSTTMFPGLRISYVIIPDSLVTKYNQKYNNYSTSVSTLTQACLAKFIENGYYASHINKLKRNYLKKRNLCIEILKPYSKLISYDAYSNYLSLLIKINKDIDEMDLISRLKKKKILIQSLQMLDVYKHQNNTLILGYTAIGLKDIPIALNILINEILNYEK